MSLKEIKTKPEGGKPKVLDSASKMSKVAMKGLWLKSKEKTNAEVKGTSFSSQQGETANAPANNAEDQMLYRKKGSQPYSESLLPHLALEILICFSLPWRRSTNKSG